MKKQDQQLALRILDCVMVGLGEGCHKETIGKIGNKIVT